MMMYDATNARDQFAHKYEREAGRETTMKIRKLQLHSIYYIYGFYFTGDIE